MEVKLLAPVQSELDEAYAYYEGKMTGLGAQFLDELIRAFKQIRAHPNAWPKFSPRTRRCLTAKFPYAVIYQIREDIILIVAVAHLHRRPDYWKDRI
ncbi:MAG: type II toxin-antitoxin system RelE/ParE family toxin [Balneolaceae bacterium]|nr:type II toxin-antitoxin system RelE/ParE family toxin [Balneolaceae bacterium]